MRLSIGHDSFGQKNMKALARYLQSGLFLYVCIETGLIMSRGTFLFLSVLWVSIFVVMCKDWVLRAI